AVVAATATAAAMAGAGPAPGLPGAGGPVVPGPGAGIPGKSGEERLKEMEAEMALSNASPSSSCDPPNYRHQHIPAVGFGPGDRSHLDSPEAREAMFLRRAVVRGLLPPLRIPELLSLRPRPRPPRPEPPPGLMALEVPEPLGEDKKKGKPEKLKRCIRTAAGSSWEDPSLLEWDADDFRIFCGDLGNEVNDDILARAFSRFPSFLKAKVIRDKRTGKTKGYGFVSFKDPSDYVRAMREMNGKYVGSRPIKLRKSMWKDRNLDVVRKKQKEKKKLGLR
ncbi:hypothetical protein E2I00_015250, partial [Balaenoptera physalus]